MRKRFLLVWLILISVILVSNQYQPDLPAVVYDVYPSVVYIEAGDDAGNWSGSGSVVDERGIILTAGHVLEGADYVSVELSDGRTIKGVDWCIDPNNDIGIVQIIDFSARKPDAIELTKDVVLGQQVFLIGSPLGKTYFNTVSVGYLSGFGRDNDLLFQFDGAANPGNSGCPAFNMDGEIVGILVSGYPWYEHLNFMVPADVCIEFIEDYIEEHS